ncbi:Cullin repeat-containing protein [Coprinopsis marcescibilis]|uniref:Cullin repeat-containing protein n=1 Tax=Coprinopsis marcescibilis TaxID=230819 RepID=A0A5C3L034_COPMA|nr:Cullin repeat-containing protein [Coprinopsis marcescibilis]
MSATGSIVVGKKPDRKANAKGVWDYLSPVTTWILQNPDGKLDPGAGFASHMELYSAVYNYSVYGYRVEAGAKGVCVMIVASLRLAALMLEFFLGNLNLAAQVLYRHLEGHLASHATELAERCRELRDTDLLNAHISELNRYEKAARKISNIFSYMDRRWVPRWREKDKTVYNICEMALRQWKPRFIDTIQANETVFSEAMLKQIASRGVNEETRELTIVKSTINSLLRLSAAAEFYDEKTKKKEECFDVYQEVFEQPFLSACRERCASQISQASAATDSTNLLRTAHRLVQETEDPVVIDLLHERTVKELVKQNNAVLVTPHVRLWWSSVLDPLKSSDQPLKSWLDLLSRFAIGQDEDFNRLWVLAGRVYNGFQCSDVALEDFVRSTTMESARMQELMDLVSQSERLQKAFGGGLDKGHKSSQWSVSLLPTWSES